MDRIFQQTIDSSGHATPTPGCEDQFMGVPEETNWMEVYNCNLEQNSSEEPQQLPVSIPNYDLDEINDYIAEQNVKDSEQLTETSDSIELPEQKPTLYHGQLYMSNTLALPMTTTRLQPTATHLQPFTPYLQPIVLHNHEEHMDTSEPSTSFQPKQEPRWDSDSESASSEETRSELRSAKSSHSGKFRKVYLTVLDIDSCDVLPRLVQSHSLFWKYVGCPGF